MQSANENLCDFEQLLHRSAAEFMTLPEDRIPELELESGGRTIAIHVLEAKPAALVFFQSIMDREPSRFKALNRAFHDAQPELNGVGWVVTRFAGAVYLSLRIGDEIYIRLVSPKCSPGALDLARRFNRFLDCNVASANTESEPSAMPLPLAQSLMN